MSSIEPKQLLNCLSGLLSINGGIKRKNEVQRIAHLMSKYSKKLVSKCIYIQILKCTETELLDLFMRFNGWLLIHLWLTESIVAKNWPLVKELLELLLLCPVDLNRLKTNNCPKLVKELSKDGDHFEIRALASKLVEQWLKTVQGEKVVPVLLTDIPQIIADASEVRTEINKVPHDVDQKNDSTVVCIEKVVNTEDEFKSEHNEPQYLVKEQKEETFTNEDKTKTEEESEIVPVLKISLKNGVQTVQQVDDSESKNSKDLHTPENSKESNKSKDKEKSAEKSSSTSKSNSSKHSSKSNSSNDKHRSSSSSKSGNSSRHSSSKDKKKDKDKSSHSSKSKSDSSKKSSSSSSSKTKEERSSKSSHKDKSREKDDKNDKKKEPKEKTVESNENKTPSISKLGKIPKLSDLNREKPSISIEVRKPDDPKPKTVKAYNSKFRKHGLEEEVKPPPSRSALLNKKVPPPPIPPTVSIPKRRSPVHNETPPEKKLKTMEIIEKPGAIKLIPPKPKPMTLLESDMFMDALNASATNKKEPKKRKRRTSGSKDGNPSDGSPPPTPTSLSSPTSDSKSVPPRFYQDTLEAEDRKEKTPESKDSENQDSAENEEDEKMETSGAHTVTVNGLKGVLCYHRKKGSKKSIKWKPDTELEKIHYFELDETERINVTKTFTDMKYLERIHEREAFQKARNLSNDDVMEERTNWKPLVLIDLDGQLQVDYGKNSKEKDIQAIRQKGTLQPLYFNKAMIPDSPFEPDAETHTYSEPSLIPLEDVTGNQDNVSDFRNMPWPEPRGNAPTQTSNNLNVGVGPLFPNNIPQFPNTFPNTQFPGVPSGFQGPNIMPSDWPNAIPQQMIPNGIPGPLPGPGVMPPGALPQGMMIPPENMMMGPEMFGNTTPMFPVPPDGFNMPQNMFPMDYNMAGHPGPNPEVFNGPGHGNFRGPMRGRGANNHWRGKVTPNWDNSRGGRGGGGGGPRGGRKTVCIYFQRKGSCRQGDNCTFLHPGVNCPF